MIKRTHAVFVVTVAAAAIGCGSKDKGETSEPTPPPGPTTMRIADVGLQTPESVMYDADTDTYLVANINGDPFAIDDNGFISRLSPDGQVVALAWIDGASETVTLNAPKGMAIAGGLLFVADVDTVRMFDVKTGEPKGDKAIEGATFLNDVAAGADGGVYVSDSGFTTGFAPSGSDAVYHVTAAGEVHALIKAADLGGPNGVFFDNGAIWVVTFGTGELYAVGSADGARGNGAKLPKGQLDGVVAIGGGELLISSWEASAVFRGQMGGEWTEAVSGVKSPADIGWDSKRRRVLIPLFMDNAIEIRTIQ